MILSHRSRAPRLRHMNQRRRSQIALIAGMGLILFGGTAYGEDLAESSFLASNASALAVPACNPGVWRVINSQGYDVPCSALPGNRNTCPDLSQACVGGDTCSTDESYCGSGNQGIIVTTEWQCQNYSNVLGYVDGVGSHVSGWACVEQYDGPIDVHIYLDGPAGTGTFLTAGTANLQREAAVGAACSTPGSAHGYSIPISGQHSGRSVWVHGLVPGHCPGGPNNLLGNSGTRVVP